MHHISFDLINLLHLIDQLTIMCESSDAQYLLSPAVFLHHRHLHTLSPIVLNRAICAQRYNYLSYVAAWDLTDPWTGCWGRC
jgi:hypothetical protein